jgi:hypothetical protein
LKSNVAACYIKTEEWKEAARTAGECLDLLDLAEGKKKARGNGENETDNRDGKKVEEEQEEEAEEEIISAGAARSEDASVDAKRKKDLDRIRAKALMRRGKARMEVGSWSSLTGAEEGKSNFSFLDTNLCHRKNQTLTGSRLQAAFDDVGCFGY